MAKGKADKRLTCSAEKKASIKESLLATARRRLGQVLRCYECKIVEKRLNRKQREELKMIFVEGKWFYNHVLGLHNSGVKLNKINSTEIKQVERLDRDGNRTVRTLEYIGSQQKQAIVTRMNQNEKTIRTLAKKGLQKGGHLRFRSELSCVPLKQYGVSYKFKSSNKVKIQGVSGDVLVRGGDQLRDVDELANANLVRRPNGYYLMVTAFVSKEN